MKSLLRIFASLLITCLFSAQLFAQDYETAIAEADALRDNGRYTEALTKLESLRIAHPGEAEILRRLANVHVDIGETSPNENVQSNHYNQAVELALAAITADSTSALAYFSGALAFGRKALISGTGDKIKLSRSVKEYSEKAIALDPELDTAYHTLARWHREVSSLGFFTKTIVRMVYGGLPDASYEDAVRLFNQAITIDDKIVHRLELGRTYLIMGNKSLAIDTLRFTINMVPIDPDDSGHQAEAQQLLNTLL